MGVPFKLTLDTVNKGLRASKVPTEEGFELRSNDRGGIFVAALVLSPFEADKATEKGSNKRSIVYLCGAWGFKMVFSLLTKVVTIYMGFILINFQGPSLKKAFLRLC